MLKPINNILLILVLASALFAQTENKRWIKQEVDYGLKIPAGKTYHIDNSGVFPLLASSAQSAYYFLFSEYDGDNCPFYPSCSAFFVQSVEERNIIKASLMFADRFTRDLNYLKGLEKYPMHSSGKFYDPPRNYALIQDEIIIIPKTQIVDEK